MSNENDKLGIRLYTDPILHKSTELVKSVDAELLEIISKMLFCMRENTGVGISANQVGINKRFCVVSLNDNKSQLAMINPEIIERSKKKILLNEGCLSAPRMWIPIKRHKKIKVKFINLKEEENECEMIDTDSRIVQHEIDHLSGRMITDKLININ